MTIEIRTLDPTTDADEWNRHVERADGTNPFFRAEAIRLQATDTQTEPHLLVGFKGQEPVGLFPVFEYARGPLTGAFSPAPRSWSPYLGPVTMNVETLKRRKADRRIRRFLEGCLAWIDAEIGPVYTKISAATFADVRPFMWNDYDVTPGYTYVVSLAGDADDLLGRFSSDARSNVRNAAADAYEITEGDAQSVDRIVAQVARRYEAQDRAFHLTPAFARQAYERLPAGSLRPYVCRVDGAFVGGILVLESDRTRFRWQGGVKPDADVDVAINDLLDWQIMRDGLEDGIDRYDMVGAGVPSINRYKAKFNPSLETHFEITDGAYGLDVMVDRYRKLR